MGVQVSHVLGAPMRLELDFDGETLTIQYHAGRISAAWISEQEAKAAEITAREDSELGVLAFNTNLIALLLSETLVDWDLYDGDTKVGTDFDTIRQLPIAVIGAVWAAISEDTQPGNGGGASGGGSRSTAPTSTR